MLSVRERTVKDRQWDSQAQEGVGEEVVRAGAFFGVDFEAALDEGLASIRQLLGDVRVRAVEARSVQRREGIQLRTQK